MIATRIFLKDMITKKKVKNYCIFIFLFFIIAYETLQEVIRDTFGNSNISYITMVLMITSTAYLIHTYSLYEKVKKYISLPISNARLLLGFVFSLILVSLLERISFLIIIVLISNNNLFVNIPLVIIVSILSILINVWILILMNKKAKLEWVLLLAVLLGYIFVSYFNFSPFISIAIILLCCVVSLIGILKEDSLYIAINKNKSALITKFKYGGNYFFKVLLNEKIYIINTLILLGMIVFLSIIQMDNFIVSSMVWTIGAVNTPVLTMLSSDPHLRRQAKMLSAKQQGIWSMYKRFVFIYFLLVNGFILALNIFFKNDNIVINICIFAVISVIEPIITFILEDKFVLTNWQTKQELWKHPRKYILPLIVFLGIIMAFILIETIG
ncbi:hypothetical protein SAMN04487886_11828 [Clostridium sp. DSM 8431]|uniref:hypothetical protein n=1 Tax=Clostridium sp. DSM 8431 TaxID=1761781 RepID=UPI0008F15492|nr:hypothetical protein [Clostridium sp. DSM 8431]SFU81343.1 hypothetical protein SAMN04487886_11828 [Clostridium sp. DSM 8431]